RAIAKDVGRSDFQLTDCRGDVIRHTFEGQWAINVCGAPVTLKLESDDLPCLCKARQQLSKRSADGGERAVQQHERLSRAMDLVIHLEAVHRNIASLCRSLADRHEPSADTRHRKISIAAGLPAKDSTPDRRSGCLSCAFPTKPAKTDALGRFQRSFATKPAQNVHRWDPSPRYAAPGTSPGLGGPFGAALVGGG